MSEPFQGDRALLEALGARIAARRIAEDRTQQSLAAEAGVGRSTVERMEAGRSTQLSSLIRVLRVLGLAERIVDLVPAAGPSPMALLRGGQGRRQRASGRTHEESSAAGSWRWGDES